MRSQFEHQGRLISYRHAQSPGPRQAGVLLLLHAFPLSADMWEPQLAAVPGGWRFVAPDLRGFGASAPDPGPPSWKDPQGRNAMSIDDYADDALALLDHLKVQAAVVCGLSMGGYAAFGVWRRAPERVRGLVLADTQPDVDSESARASRQQMLDLLAREGVPTVGESMLPRLLGQTTLDSAPRVVERVRQLAAAQSPEAVGAAIVRLMSRPDSTPLLPLIERPVLVVAGEEDRITGPDVARQMHGQVEGADLALIPHAGHLSNLEKPEAFSVALDRFLVTRFSR